MAKPTLKDRLAALKAKKATVTVKEAKVQVVAAWTLAKTVLPTAPTEVQQKFASAIVGLDSKILRASVKQAAINSYWSKFADEMEQDGCGLNKFLEDESMLDRLKSEIKKEFSGKPVNAALEAPHEAQDVPGEGEYEAPKVGSEKKADYEDPQEEQKKEDEQVKVDLSDQIADAETAVNSLEDEIKEEGEEELDFDKMFEHTEEKLDSLANEGDFDGVFGEEGEAHEEGEGEGHEGIIIDIEHDMAPSDSASLEKAMDGLDQVELSDAADFFSHAAGEEDDFQDLFESPSKESEVDMGEAADFFSNDAVSGEDFGSEQDHEDDLIYSVMMQIKPETYKTKRDTEPHLEEPKKAKAAASKKNPSKPIRSLGHVTTASAEQDMLAKLVFPDDDDYA
jgi:hypothetical protein